MSGKNKIIYLLLALALFSMVRCSSTKVNKTLTFFFDGVDDSQPLVPGPANTSPAVTAAKKTETSPVIPSPESRFKLHKPYQEHQCGKCHDSTNMSLLIRPKIELCFSCHDAYEKKYAFVHGPVSVGYCLACHNPHMSENSKLLTRVNEKVCYYCHTKKQVLQNKKHEGVDLSNCTGCHNPHGGKDPGLLN